MRYLRRNVPLQHVLQVDMHLTRPTSPTLQTRTLYGRFPAVTARSCFAPCSAGNGFRLYSTHPLSCYPTFFSVLRHSFLHATLGGDLICFTTCILDTLTQNDCYCSCTAHLNSYLSLLDSRRRLVLNLYHHQNDCNCSCPAHLDYFWLVLSSSIFPPSVGRVRSVPLLF